MAEIFFNIYENKIVKSSVGQNEYSFLSAVKVILWSNLSTTN